MLPHHRQPVLLAWASPQHRSPVQVLPSLLHQQTRPTRPSRQYSPHQLPPSADQSPETGRTRVLGGHREGRNSQRVFGHLPSLPGARCPGWPGEAELRRPSWQHREQQLRQPRGKGGHCRWGPADVCQRAQLLCQGALAGGSVDSQRSALHLPAPPVAFRAYVSAPRLGSPRQHRCSPGSRARGLHPHPGRASAASAPEPQPGPRQKAVVPQGMLTRPVSATRPHPGRDGSAGEAPPFCPRASLHAHPVDLSQAQRAAELPWNYWSTK